MIEWRVQEEELAIVNLTRELSQAKIQRTNQRAYYEDAVFNLHNFRVRRDRRCFTKCWYGSHLHQKCKNLENVFNNVFWLIKMQKRLSFSRIFFIAVKGLNQAFVWIKTFLFMTVVKMSKELSFAKFLHDLQKPQKLSTILRKKLTVVYDCYKNAELAVIYYVENGIIDIFCWQKDFWHTLFTRIIKPKLTFLVNEKIQKHFEDICICPLLDKGKSNW